MRFSRLVFSLAVAFALYFFVVNQSNLIGRTVIVADEFQISLLISMLAFYSLLASVERVSTYRLAVLPFILIVIFDITFNSLLSLGYPQYYVVYQNLRTLLALFTGSLAFSYIKFTDHPIYQTAISVSALCVAAFSSYYLFTYLSEVLDVPSLALPSLALFLILAATILTSAFEGEVFEWIRSERSFFILILFILTFYALIIKPHLANRPGIADFLEWAVIALTFIKVSRDFRRRVEVEEREIIAAHKPKERFFKDRIYSELEFGEKAFLDDGLKIPLTVSLVRTLSEVETSRIAEILAPLLSYQDEKVPALAFPWEREILERRNRKRREKVLEMIKAELAREVKDFNL